MSKWESGKTCDVQHLWYIWVRQNSTYSIIVRAVVSQILVDHVVGFAGLVGAILEWRSRQCGHSHDSRWGWRRSRLGKDWSSGPSRKSHGRGCSVETGKRGNCVSWKIWVKCETGEDIWSTNLVRTAVSHGYLISAKGTSSTPEKRLNVLDICQPTPEKGKGNAPIHRTSAYFQHYRLTLLLSRVLRKVDGVPFANFFTTHSCFTDSDAQHILWLRS